MYGCRAIKTVNLGPYPSELSEWLRQFKVKLVDVNRVSKGSPTGRISQFSALTVAGNKDVSYDVDPCKRQISAVWSIGVPAQT